jgi:UDP-N-acetylglucosamine transferase subunit ALG13
MSFAETLEHIDKASAIIGHAGAGTILSAVRAGHVPIAMPRLKEFDEAIDDHQLYFARALSASGRIILVEKPDEIPAGVSQVPVRGSAVTPGEGGLVAAVRAELHRPRRDDS